MCNVIKLNNFLYLFARGQSSNAAGAAADARSSTELIGWNHGREATVGETSSVTDGPDRRHEHGEPEDPGGQLRPTETPGPARG